MSHLFFIKSFDNTVFSETESGHLIRVLRKQVGDRIEVTDGKGHYAQGIITEAHPKKCAFSIESMETHSSPFPYTIHLAIAPPKSSDRLEWMLEKLMEIGITEITFLITEHSERKNINIDKLQSICIAAIKQSKQFFLPILHPPTFWKDFVKNRKETQRYIAYLSPEPLPHLATLAQPKGSILLCIGPEGDFSSIEIKDAMEQQWTPVSLGPSILRTETAGFLAVNVIHLTHVWQSSK